MPNLREWIEAQLKRGYTKEHIKSFLIRKGYPQTAVAEVDKISAIKASHKTSNQKPSYSIAILLIAVILLIVIAIFIYSSYQGVEEQGTAGKTAKQEISEKGLENAKETEAMKDKEQNKEFNKDFCNALMPENIHGMQVSEYTLTYHIDGSKGENIIWSASEQPKAEFSLFESPKVFFVSSNEFEGCGYKQEIEAKGIKTELRDKYGLPYLCKGKEVYITQKFHESYTIITFYQPESEDKTIVLKISIKPEFGNKERVLISMGCENE